MTAELAPWVRSAMAIARASALSGVPLGLLGPEGLWYDDPSGQPPDNALADHLNRFMQHEFESGVHRY
ncbi:MAG: hypothetical protein AAFU65_16155, partial [Pseudomonadota bacterium]